MPLSVICCNKEVEKIKHCVFLDLLNIKYIDHERFLPDGKYIGQSHVYK